ncbi:uncharacterized protein A4U43_C08F32690 [Asparagus officinalis]|nr:uncharacterized protein A4U43_C08F32690 [Asparagus officinalis]
MGSEGPSAITVHVTGFKKFHGEGALGPFYELLESTVSGENIDDLDAGRIIWTSLPVGEITKSLTSMGYPVMPSDDAGRFVCNYVYYHSLRFAEHNGNRSLFVHVPLFMTIDEESQMEFVASLLEVLASLRY